MKHPFFILILLLNCIGCLKCQQYFKIAGVVPITGQLSDQLYTAIQGYQFFCDQLNQQGGFSIAHNGGDPFLNDEGNEHKFYFDCKFIDDQSNLNDHIERYQELISDPSVDFLVGGHYLFSYQTITTLMNQTEKIMINCCEPRKEIYEMDFKNVFGMSVSNTRFIDDTIKKIALNNIQNLCIFYQNDHSFTKPVCESAILSAKDRRINITIESTFNTSILYHKKLIQQQIKALVNQSKNIGSEAIIACVLPGVAEQLTLEIANQKLSLKAFFLTDAPWYESYRENVGNLAEYVLSAGQWHRGIKYSDPFFGNNQKFVKQYSDVYQEQPQQFSALAAATMEAYLEAIKSAFVQCDISRTNGSVELLLYGNETVYCRDKFFSGYELVHDALYKLRIDTFLGGIYFNQFRQNTALVPPTIQILKSKKQQGELEDFCVLPLKYAEARITMPQPNRYPKDCKPGFISAVGQQYGNCQACPEGKRRCETCPQTSCEYCSRWEYNNMTGQSECSECPVNTEAIINGATNIQQCQCKPAFYHPQYQVGVACQECPAGGVCPGHNKTIYAKKGYWITQQLPQQIYQCNQQGICNGGETNFCKTGYTGVMCSTCDNGYFKVLRSCQKCPSKIIMLVYIICIALFWWILSSILTRYVDCFGVILNWFQLLRVVGMFVVNWPPSIFWILSTMALSSFEVDVIELTCLNPNWSFLHSFSMQLILPVLVGIFSAISYLFSYAYYHYWYSRSGQKINAVIAKSVSFLVLFPTSRNELRSAKNFCIAAFFSFLNGSFIAIAEACFDSFSCVEIGGEMYVKNNFEIKCSGKEYRLIRILGLISLLIYIIPYPLYLVIVSIQLKRKKAFHHMQKLQRLGWFYKKYEVEWYWYELTHLGHRTVFVIIFFFVPSPMMQCIYATGVTIALLLLQIYSRPYIDVSLDILQIFLLIALMLIIFSGLIFYNPIILQSDKKLVEIFIECILALFGCIFIGFLLRDLLQKLIHVWATCKIKKASGMGHTEQDNLSQLMRAFELRYFLPWLFQSTEKEQKEMLKLSKVLGDYVSNESDTSYLSTTKTGRWWRELSQRFPEVIDFLAVADENAKQNFVNFVEVLYKDFYRHKGETNIHQMISWQDRAAIAQWLTLASTSNRKLFNKVALLVFKLVKGDEVAKQLRLRVASNGKIIQSNSGELFDDVQPRSLPLDFLAVLTPSRNTSQMSINLDRNLDRNSSKFFVETPKTIRNFFSSSRQSSKNSGSLNLDEVLTQKFRYQFSIGRGNSTNLKFAKSLPVVLQTINSTLGGEEEIEVLEQGQGQVQGYDRSTSPLTNELLQNVSSYKTCKHRRHKSDSGQNLVDLQQKLNGPLVRKSRKVLK